MKKIYRSQKASHRRSNPGHFRTLIAILAATLGLTAGAQAQFINNGDFETITSTPPPFIGWTISANAALVAPTPISGTYSVEMVPATSGRMYQLVNDPSNLLNSYTVDLDFASSNPGSASARSLNLLLQTTASFTTFNQINLRLVEDTANGLGSLQAYNNSAWVTVLPDAVTFSSSTASLSVHHLQVVGHNTAAKPNYDLYVVSPSGVTNSVLGLTSFQGTAPVTGSTLKQISFETGNNAAGSFYVVDNVVITNFGGGTSVAPAIGSQPTGMTVLNGDLVPINFMATFAGTPPLFTQWLFNGVPIPGATNSTANSSTLTLSNITAAAAGSYSFTVSNSLGGAISSNAVLTVTPVLNTTQTTNIWTLLPGSVPYLATSGNTERGLAYDAVSGDLLLASRAGGSNTMVALNPQTGTENHWLNVDPGVVNSGSVALSAIGVADDGVVFASDITTAAGSPPYRLYRWADDGAGTEPILVFAGDPDGNNLRWGDNLAVRGAGPNTQILIAPGSGTNVVLLQSQDGLDFETEIPPAVIAVSGVSSGFAQLGLAYGPGTNTFWAKTAGGRLQLIQFDLNSNTGAVIYASSTNAVAGNVGALAVNTNLNLLAALAFDNPANVHFYDVSNPTADPVLLDQKLFTSGNANVSVTTIGTGALAFGGNTYLFALNSNNGIQAFTINTNFTATLAPFSITNITAQSGSVILTWPSVPNHSYQVQAASSLSNASWSNVGNPMTAAGSTTSFTNSLSGTAQFYRIQGQ